MAKFYDFHPVKAASKKDIEGKVEMPILKIPPVFGRHSSHCVSRKGYIGVRRSLIGLYNVSFTRIYTQTKSNG